MITLTESPTEKLLRAVDADEQVSGPDANSPGVGAFIHAGDIQAVRQIEVQPVL